MGDWTTIGTTLAGGGVFGVLAVVIIALLRSQPNWGTINAASVRDAEARADAAEKREEAVRAKAAEREQKLQEQLDDALAARRHAEDQYAQVMREVRDLRSEVEALRRELARAHPVSGGGGL